MVGYLIAGHIYYMFYTNGS